MSWIWALVFLEIFHSRVIAKNIEPLLSSPRQPRLTSFSPESSDEEDVPFDGDYEEEDPSFNKRLQGFFATFPRSKQEVMRTATNNLEAAADGARYFLREVKGTHSSEFECAVIKGTRPDSHPPKEKHVQRLVETVATFPIAMTARSAHSTPSTDYYSIMLHKLWSRMVEKDWRTVVKAVYVLHRISIALDPELHQEFLRRFQTLRKTQHKRSKSKYFSLSMLTRCCKREDSSFIPFVASYSAFVFERFVLFSGRFEKGLRPDSSQGGFESTGGGSLLDLLKSSCRVLERAMQITWKDTKLQDSKVKSEHHLVSYCLELVIKDMFVSGRSQDSLWRVFAENFSQLLAIQEEVLAAGDQIDPIEARATCRLCAWGIQAPRLARRFLDDAKEATETQRLPALVSIQGMPSETVLREHAKRLEESQAQ